MTFILKDAYRHTVELAPHIFRADNMLVQACMAEKVRRAQVEAPNFFKLSVILLEIVPDALRVLVRRLFEEKHGRVWQDLSSRIDIHEELRRDLLKMT